MGELAMAHDEINELQGELEEAHGKLDEYAEACEGVMMAMHEACGATPVDCYAVELSRLIPAGLKYDFSNRRTSGTSTKSIWQIAIYDSPACIFRAEEPTFAALRGRVRNHFRDSKEVRKQ